VIRTWMRGRWFIFTDYSRICRINEIFETGRDPECDDVRACIISTLEEVVYHASVAATPTWPTAREVWASRLVSRGVDAVLRACSRGFRRVFGGTSVLQVRTR